MNNISQEQQERMLLAYYGELSPAEQLEFDKECSANPELASAFKAMSSTMKSFDSYTQQEPSEDFFTALEYNIHAGIRREEQPIIKQIETKTPWWQTLKEFFLTPQRIGYTLAGGVACMIMGVFVGSMLQRPISGDFTGSQVAEISSVTPSQATSSEQVSNFLRKSQLYLVTSVDEEVKCEKCIPLKSQYDNRKLATDLLKEASALREALKNNPDKQKLLTDIEFVLNSISNSTVANPAQAEIVHHVASTALCETTKELDSTKSLSGQAVPK
jgi:hypothetical protein